MQTKSYPVEFKIEGEREVVSIISTDCVDRDNEVVLPSGLNKKNYAGNPVVLVNHDHKQLPVGKCLWIKAVGNQILAKTYITDKTQLGRDIWGLIQDGIISAVSIGMDQAKGGPPTTKEIQKRPDWATARNMIREFDLIEYSFVCVPANPQALILAHSKGYSPDTLKFLGLDLAPVESKPELTTVNPVNSAPVPVLKKAKAKLEIPEPKYCKAWSEVQRDIKRLINDIRSEDFLDRYRGRI